MIGGALGRLYKVGVTLTQLQPCQRDLRRYTVRREVRCAGLDDCAGNTKVLSFNAGLLKGVK